MNPKFDRSSFSIIFSVMYVFFKYAVYSFVVHSRCTLTAVTKYSKASKHLKQSWFDLAVLSSNVNIEFPNGYWRHLSRRSSRFYSGTLRNALKFLLLLINVETVILYSISTSIQRSLQHRFVQWEQWEVGTVNSISTPKRCLLAHFEATFDFSRSEFTCP